MATRTPAKNITEKNTLVNINNPSQLAAFANDLKDFVVSNHLYTEIVSNKKNDKGEYVQVKKNYVNVEGWQFAGASMGIFPVVLSEENISPTDKYIEINNKWVSGGVEQRPVYKYKVTVELIQLSTGNVVGRGIAMCSNEEFKKSTFDEYAVLSMAQTRATGKAFRLSLGWIMKLAGYEATPSEEVDDEPVNTVPEEPKTRMEIPIDDLKILVNVKLDSLQAAEKIKFLKDTIGTVNAKSITDDQYRRIFDRFQELKEAGNV